MSKTKVNGASLENGPIILTFNRFSHKINLVQ